MDKEIEDKFNKLLNNLDGLITSNGLKISGQGMIADNTKKIGEKLDKIERLIYFMEQRQQKMFSLMEKHLNK